MATPIAYHGNTLLRALEGKGAGTIYNSAVSATPDQTNKRFTMGTQTRIADLSGVSDDFFNGFDLYFPASDTTYHIIDWEEGLGRATVAEMPSLLDTGACQFRKALWSPNLLAANPASMACDGILNRVHKIVSTSASLDVMAFLPNFVQQNGFEELAAGALPSGTQAPGLWYSGSQFTVSNTTPLLGSRMGIWTPTSGTTDLQQRLIGTFKKGRRYRIALKVQAVTGATAAGAVLVYVQEHTSSAHLDADFDTNGEWDLGSVGTTATWVTADFVPDFETSTARLWIAFVYANRGSATVVRIDEVYIWDVTSVPSALLAFTHNWSGAASLEVRGYYGDPSRTSVGSADYAVLSAPGTVSGSGPVLREWTVADPPTIAQAFPIYRISIPASASFQYQVGELLLAKKWAWLTSPELDFDPDRYVYRENRVTAISGLTVRTLYSKARQIQGRMKFLPAADAAVWVGAFREFALDNNEPFAVFWAGLWDTPILVQNVRDEVGVPFEQPNWRGAEFEWMEIVA